MDKLLLTLMLHHEGNSYRAKASAKHISIKRLPKGETVLFSTTNDGEHSALARTVFDGIGWDVPRLKEMLALYERTARDLGVSQT